MQSVRHSWSMSRAIRVVILLTILTLVTILSIDALIYVTITQVELAETQEELELLRTLRELELTEYLQTVRGEVVLWSHQQGIEEALNVFSAGWQQIAQEPSRELQRLYIDENPYPIGQKDKLDDAEDGSLYSAAHAKYHPWLRSFVINQGYYDVFLFDTEGNLVYTVFKERDYATNALDGPYRKTGLAEVFRAVQESDSTNVVAFSDFAPYEPSDDAPASFIASPVHDHNNDFVGVFAFQLPSESINEIMQFTVSLGQTGETYIVGSDHLMRSDSRFSEVSTILKTKVDTQTVAYALEGERGFQITNDYRNIPVLSAYSPLEFEGVRWAIMAEIDQAEVLAPVTRLRQLVLSLCLLILFIAALIGLYDTITHRISRNDIWY